MIVLANSPTESADDAAHQWLRGLESCDHAERVAQMTDRYRWLAMLSESERRSRLTDVILEENTVGDPRFLALTAARLEAWTALSHQDAAAARTVASSFDAVYSQLAPEIDLRRAHAAQCILSGNVPQEMRSAYADLMPRLAYLVPPEHNADR